MTQQFSQSTLDNSAAYDSTRTNNIVRRLIAEFDCFLDENTAVNNSLEHLRVYSELRDFDAQSDDDFELTTVKEVSSIEDDVTSLRECIDMLLEKNVDEYITRKARDLKIELECYSAYLAVLKEEVREHTLESIEIMLDNVIEMLDETEEEQEIARALESEAFNISSSTSVENTLISLAKIKNLAIADNKRFEAYQRNACSSDIIDFIHSLQ